MINPILFYSLSTLICLGALGVVLARNPVYAVLSLVVSLFALSALFVALEAYFVAVIQILVYAGAVLVLFLFVLMLLDIAPDKVLRTRTRTFRVAGTLLGLGFLLQVSRIISESLTSKLPLPETGLVGTTATIGKSLFTTYALPFEVASLLLLAGIVGAIVLAKREA
jgi:NADH-quinone oxidoreductase subunit J